MARVRDRGARAMSMGAVSLLAAFAAVALVTGCSYLASSRAPRTAALLSSETKMEGFLGRAAKGMATLEAALPKGAIARKFPAEEARLRSAYERGERELGAIAKEVKQAEAQRHAAAVRHAAHKAAAAASSGPAARVSSLSEVKSSARSMQDLVAREEQSMRTLIAEMPAKDRAVFPREAKAVASVLSHSIKELAAIESETARAAAKRGVRLSSLARGGAYSARQLDADKTADDTENKALSTAADVEAVMGTINALPKPVRRAEGAAARTEVKKARVQSLAGVGGDAGPGSMDATEETPERRWGTVYNPTAKRDSLHGAARRQYARWTDTVNKISDVYDPAADKTTPDPFNQLKTTDWWKSDHYKISATSGQHPTDDAWWNHNHEGRGW